MTDSSLPSKQDDVLEAVGVVYTMNDRLRTGVVKLFDNRRVEFDYRSVTTEAGLLKLRDEVRVRAKSESNRLKAESVSKLEKAIGSEDLVGTPSAIQTAFPFLQDLDEAEEYLQSAEGNPLDVDRLYEQAAVARAEDRFSEARDLFEQAIRLGGGPKVFGAYAKMLIEGRGRDAKRARDLLDRAINAFPGNATFYVMFGQMERRAGNLTVAEGIFRRGLAFNSRNTILRTSLAQVLAQIATAASLKEAAEIFSALESEGKLNKRDNSYTRFRALASNPRAGRTYLFFENAPGFRPGIPGRRDIPAGVTDLVVEITDAELEGSFDVSGAYLVRCFSGDPKRSEIIALSRYLRSLKADATVGLISGRELVINTSLAFVSIPKTSTVRDYLMSILAENNEAILPIEEKMLVSPAAARERVRDILSQYLGSRDLYDSTLPVSGRRLFGREKLLVQLVNHIQRGEFIGLFGLRKMGKTSLVYQLRDEKLKDEAVAYVDLQSSPGLSIHSFGPVYWEIERDLLNRLSGAHPFLKNVLRLGQYERFSDVVAANVNPGLYFGEDVRALLDLIHDGALEGIGRLVIVIDELERCLPLASQPPMEGYMDFFGILRGLAQTDRYRGLLSSVVIAANAAISERAYWDGRENPVFSLYKTIFVPPLSQPDTSQMIQTLGKGMSVYWDPAALRLAFEECGGHPFLTRVLCSQVAARHPQRPLQVTERMVQNELPIFIRDRSDKFQQIVELLHSHFPEEERLLEELAVNSDVTRAAEQHIPHLLGYQLIREYPGGYDISIRALKSWLRRRAGVGHG